VLGPAEPDPLGAELAGAARGFPHTKAGESLFLDELACRREDGGAQVAMVVCRH
jgi:hypothetical protein